ncbi:hypothetical protein [Nocardioides conyzicola]|uniref:Secreted protein n=1 Tax=Nocardioides conyzicola TaxID=1651781 RepID=A0ABP8XF96_9ACTN
MGRRTRALRYAVVAVSLLTLAACDSDDEPGAEPTASTTPADPSTSSAPSSATPSASRSAGGTADAPEALTATTALLDWQQVEGSIDDAVTRNDAWSISVAEDGSTYRLVKLASGGRSSGQVGANPGWRVSDALLDEDWAVVVLQDEQEQRPSRAMVTDLETGKAYELNGRSDAPTTTGGTWALGDGRLLHATVDQSGAYCLASVDLESRRSTVGWCAPKRSGFNAAHVTGQGDSLLTFDDSQPSCRTVVSVADGTATPFPGATECKSWEGLLLEDASIWSTIPRERRIEEAHLYARVGDGYFDLGPGVAGTLTACDDAAYFVRDPQQKGDPAALMRWTPDDGLTVAYESAKGQAFIEQPRCGGDAITITARTSSGDEQVSADL